MVQGGGEFIAAQECKVEQTGFLLDEMSEEH
jgi:hypothetical protein